MDIPLTEHPLGTMPDSTPLSQWEGTISELQTECRQLIKDARAALRAICENPQEPYDESDEAIALEMATESGMEARALLAVVYKQQIVWNRAKGVWPTMQYQFKLSTELSKRTFQLVPLLSSCIRLAPQELADSLKDLLKRLEQTSYRVRFTYQELHDLAVVSQHYYGLLKPGWDENVDNWELADLQAAVKAIFQWSEDSEAVRRWHLESREKTWELRQEDPAKSLVPEAAWYRFGNPSEQEESQDILGMVSVLLRLL